MPTTVPRQRTEVAAIRAAVALERDCVAAYGAAARRLRAAPARDTLRRMHDSCRGHVDRWQQRLQQMGHGPAVDGLLDRLSHAANGAKVRVAAKFGDDKVLRVIANNPRDSQTAYAAVAAGRIAVPRGTVVSLPTTTLAGRMLEDARADGAALTALREGLRDAGGR